MPLQSRTRLATLTGVKCSTSQCELRSTFPNLRVTNVIRIVTYYTLPPLESPTSSWMTRSQRSRRRDKGLWGLYSCIGRRAYIYADIRNSGLHTIPEIWIYFISCVKACVIRRDHGLLANDNPHPPFQVSRDSKGRQRSV